MGARMLRPSGRVVVTTSPADAPAGQLTRTRAGPWPRRRRRDPRPPRRAPPRATDRAPPRVAAAPEEDRAAARGPLLARAARLRDAELGAGRGEHLDVRPREAQVRPQLVAHGGKGRDLGRRRRQMVRGRRPDVELVARRAVAVREFDLVVEALSAPRPSRRATAPSSPRRGRGP